jgi:luciferase family oxidoreductase group 1
MLLSVLDQSPISEGSTGAQALHNTLDLARLADALGYHRYWVAEHHGGPMLASAGPEVLIGSIAAATEGIRVGSGGVMLPHYSPLKVAETFTILAALYPGRIDLGLGRASGTDPLTTYALQRDRRQAAPDDFPQQLAELLAYFGDSLPDDHPFQRLAATLPGLPELPVPWLLGSSAQSAIWAAQLGLPYAFADFINPAGAEIARLYRERFEPSADLAAPRTAVAAWVLCAATDEEAQYLASSGRMTRRLLRQGELIAVPPPEKALAYLERVGSLQSSGGRRAIVGSPEKVRARLEELAQEYGADEVIVVTITYDHQARRRSYELLAEAFGLPRRSPGGRDARAAAARSASEPRHDQAGRTSSGWNGPTDAGRSPAPLTT